jgi:hypothetical protein
MRKPPFTTGNFGATETLNANEKAAAHLFTYWF